MAAWCFVSHYCFICRYRFLSETGMQDIIVSLQLSFVSFRISYPHLRAFPCITALSHYISFSLSLSSHILYDTVLWTSQQCLIHYIRCLSTSQLCPTSYMAIHIKWHALQLSYCLSLPLIKNKNSSYNTVNHSPHAVFPSKFWDVVVPSKWRYKHGANIPQVHTVFILGFG